jgi:AcrR family transcriptional regulator
MIRGRPLGGSFLNRDEILSTALKLLEESGPGAVSLRAIAKKLGVTPMAIYGHFSDKEGLVRGMSDAIYVRVLSAFRKKNGKPQDLLESLLVNYYEAVVQLPQLTLLIFATPAEFSSEVQSITKHLSDLLSKSKLSLPQRKLWLEILVDLTHGSALATASIPETNREFLNKQKRRFRQQLEEMFSHIF